MEGGTEYLLTHQGLQTPKLRLRISKLGQGTSFFRREVVFFSKFFQRNFETRKVEVTGNCIAVPGRGMASSGQGSKLKVSVVRA